jgi:hypothetical protein
MAAVVRYALDSYIPPVAANLSLVHTVGLFFYCDSQFLTG